MTLLLEKMDQARELLLRSNLVCFTMDVDWASEYAIEQAVTLFERAGIPITIFVTHKSKVIDQLKNQGKIKCGIHPNFMPDSSQGKTYQEVVDFCFDLLPDAKLFRAHRYYDVNDTLDLLTQRGIVCESNVCTLLDILPPFLHRSGMVSFPVFWEDGAYLYHNAEIDYNAFFKRFLLPGIKVINIHPMHLMLNTPYFRYTRDIKDRLTRYEWNHLDAQSISKIAFQGDGITTFIKRMLNDVKSREVRAAYLEDVYDWIQTL